MMSQPSDLPPDLEASVQAAVESLRQEEIAYARAFANIWEEGYLAALDEKHQQDDNPYLARLKELEAHGD